MATTDSSCPQSCPFRSVCSILITNCIAYLSNLPAAILAAYIYVYYYIIIIIYIQYSLHFSGRTCLRRQRLTLTDLPAYFTDDYRLGYIILCIIYIIVSLASQPYCECYLRIESCAMYTDHRLTKLLIFSAHRLRYLYNHACASVCEYSRSKARLEVHASCVNTMRPQLNYAHEDLSYGHLSVKDNFCNGYFCKSRIASSHVYYSDRMCIIVTTCIIVIACSRGGQN